MSPMWVRTKANTKFHTAGCGIEDARVRRPLCRSPVAAAGRIELRSFQRRESGNICGCLFSHAQHYDYFANSTSDRRTCVVAENESFAISRQARCALTKYYAKLNKRPKFSEGRLTIRGGRDQHDRQRRSFSQRTEIRLNRYHWWNSTP